MAATTKTTRSLKVACPFCNQDGAVTLDLNDLNEITCGDCSETFTARAAVEAFLEKAARWEAVAEWIRMAPIV